MGRWKRCWEGKGGFRSRRCRLPRGRCRFGGRFCGGRWAVGSGVVGGLGDRLGGDIWVRWCRLLEGGGGGGRLALLRVWFLFLVDVRWRVLVGGFPSSFSAGFGILLLRSRYSVLVGTTANLSECVYDSITVLIYV